MKAMIRRFFSTVLLLLAASYLVYCVVGFPKEIPWSGLMVLLIIALISAATPPLSFSPKKLESDLRQTRRGDIGNAHELLQAAVFGRLLQSHEPGAKLADWTEPWLRGLTLERSCNIDAALKAAKALQAADEALNMPPSLVVHTETETITFVSNMLDEAHQAINEIDPSDVSD